MYEFPYGAGQQLNLNWIINEIITLHKQLDPDWDLPQFETAFPYTNLNTLNLDWILRELKAIKDLAPAENAQLLKMVANALIANTYDAETQYNVDDIVYRDSDNRLYKCITATPVGGEPFDNNKWVEVDVGGVLTDLLNSVVTPPTPYDSNPTMDGTASAGTSTQYARGDHVHPKDSARVPTSRTVNGKALSSNITLNASDIPNDSNVTGDNVDDALDNLNGAINDIEHQITNFIETGETASQTYYKGAYLVWKGGLYRVIVSVINQGDAFVVDTNIKALTLESVLVTLTVPINVPDEAGLKRTSFNFMTSAPIPLGSTGVTIETYAVGTVISLDGTNGMLFASGYSGNLYVAYLNGGIFVRAQVYDNRGESITLTHNQTYVSSTSGVSCKRTGNIVTFAGTIVLGASAITDNLLLSGFPAPSAAVDIFGTIVEATDTSQRGKTGRYRIKTDGTLVPWYNSWGASEQGSSIAFNTTYII